MTIPELQAALEVLGEPTIKAGVVEGRYVVSVLVVLKADAGLGRGDGEGADLLEAITTALDQFRVDIERKRAAAVPR